MDKQGHAIDREEFEASVAQELKKLVSTGLFASHYTVGAKCANASKNHIHTPVFRKRLPKSVLDSLGKYFEKDDNVHQFAREAAEYVFGGKAQSRAIDAASKHAGKYGYNDLEVKGLFTDFGRWVGKVTHSCSACVAAMALTAAAIMALILGLQAEGVPVPVTVQILVIEFEFLIPELAAAIVAGVIAGAIAGEIAVLLCPACNHSDDDNEAPSIGESSEGSGGGSGGRRPSHTTHQR